MTNRRGFLGLLGAASASLPFLGNAVALKSDPITGALTIDAPQDIIVDQIESPPFGSFVVIPVHALRDISSGRPRQRRIDITTYDDATRVFDYSDTYDIELRIAADRELVEHIYTKFAHLIGGQS